MSLNSILNPSVSARIADQPGNGTTLDSLKGEAVRYLQTEVVPITVQE
jgi:hypothetical protein